MLVNFIYILSYHTINYLDYFTDSYVEIFSVNTGKILQFDSKDFTNQPTFQAVKGNKKFLLRKYKDKYVLKILNLYFCIDGLNKTPCYLSFKNTPFGFHIENEDNQKCLNLFLNGDCNKYSDLNYIFDLKYHKKRKECDEYETPTSENNLENIKSFKQIESIYPELKNKPTAKKWFKSIFKDAKKQEKSKSSYKWPSWSWPKLFC